MEVDERSVNVIAALVVIKNYYDCLKQRDATGAIALLSDDVCVTFPQPKDNWQGKVNARKPFERFLSLSDLEIRYEAWEHEDGLPRIRVEASFTKDGQVRELCYTVIGGYITSIHHGDYKP